MLICWLFEMPNFCKENHCLLCPKVFCCPECRCKHESSVHKTEIICYICAKLSKPPFCNKQFTMNSKPVLSERTAVKISVKSSDECSPKTPPLDNGNVKQLIKEFSKATPTPHFANEKEKKSVIFDSNHQEGCKQFSLQIGATSTPYQINIVKESDVIKGTNFLQENSDDRKKKNEENYSESILPENVPVTTEISNSKPYENLETQTIMDGGGLDLSDLVTLSIKSTSSIVTDIWENESDRTPSSPIDNGETTLEERDNILNEETDSKGPIDTLLWKSACSSVDQSQATKHSGNLPDKEETSSTSEYLQVFKSAYSETLEATTDDDDDDRDIKFQRSTSIVDLSQGVWKTITDSIRSALNSTRELCNITNNISKRSLDTADYDEPSAKRRKYEPYLKCRPPIHDLGIIVFSRLSSQTTLRMDKATQTEDCYFT